MSVRQYQRKRNLFSPKAKTPFRLSRSKLESFLNCPRCFYLDRRLGVGSPGIPAFTLNSAVDHLLKVEFDLYRVRQKAHPIMEEYGIDAVPFAHPMMDEWRENFKGIQHFHKSTNLIIFGAVDDIWINQEGVLFVVDYKSTSSSQPITLDGPYRQAFKRQIEIYQWLLRESNFIVSDIGYFVYCNALRSKDVFDRRLDFTVEIISYEGNSDWVEGVVVQAKECLLQEHLPEPNPECEYCLYRKAAYALGDQNISFTQGELF